MRKNSSFLSTYTEFHKQANSCYIMLTSVCLGPNDIVFITGHSQSHFLIICPIQAPLLIENSSFFSNMFSLSLLRWQYQYCVNIISHMVYCMLNQNQYITSFSCFWTFHIWVICHYYIFRMELLSILGGEGGHSGMGCVENCEKVSP